MIDSLRRGVSSWLVKGFLGLLILSFAVWGISDIFIGPRGTGVVAEVDGLEVTAADLAREFEENLLELRRIDPTIDRDHPLAAAVLNQSLGRLVSLRRLEAWARDLDLGVSEEELRAHIQSEPLFQSNGRYDPERLRLVLRSQGMSESAFIESVEREIVRARVIQALGAAVTGSEELAARLWRFREERRDGEALLVEAAAMEVPEPTEEMLRAFYEENKDRFRRPEYRKVTLVRIRPEDLLAEIAVPEEEVRALYEQRRAALERPERRAVQQLIAEEEAVARTALERIQAGQSPEEVASALPGVRLVSLDPVEESGLPEELAELVFALGEGEVGGPVATPFGWHVVQVVRIQPAGAPPFAEVREALARELARRMAADQLPQLAADVDDALAAGDSLEEAAETFGLEVVRIAAVDARGLTPEGTPAGEGMLTPEMLERMFAAAEGETSLVEELSDGSYLVFRVDGVEPERTLTFEEARERIVDALVREQKLEAARALARTLITEASAGARFAELAERYPGVRRVELSGVRRDDDGSRFGLPQAAIAALFDLEEGMLAEEPLDGPGGAVVVRLLRVVPAPEPERLDGLVAEVASAWRNDLLLLFEQALADRYEVEVNERLLAAFLAPGG